MHEKWSFTAIVGDMMMLRKCLVGFSYRHGSSGFEMELFIIFLAMPSKPAMQQQLWQPTSQAQPHFLLLASESSLLFCLLFTTEC